MTAPHRNRVAAWRASPTSAELVSAGVRPDLLVFLALRRSAGGGVVKFGDRYFEWGYRTPGWLAGVFDELTRTGFLALAAEQPSQVWRLSLTAAGQLRYRHLSSARTPLSAPAGRRADAIAPGLIGPEPPTA